MARLIPAAERPLRDAYGLILGQSLGLQYSQSGGLAAMTQEIIARASPRVRSVQAVNGCLPGRFICKSTARAVKAGTGQPGSLAANAFWWDDEAGGPGGILDSLIASARALPAGASVSFAIWNQGQAESNVLSGATDLSIAAGWDLYDTSLRAIIGHVRARLDRPALPFFLDLPPSSSINRNRAYERLRQCLLSVAANTPAVYPGADGYDLSRRDSTHYSHLGARELGRRAGHNIAGQVYGAPGVFRGPRVARVAGVSATETDIVIEVEPGDTLIRPAGVPAQWRIESSTAYGIALPLAGVAWSGDTARVTHAECAGTPVFFPAYDSLPGYSPRSWVGGAVSGMPLRSFRQGRDGPLHEPWSRMCPA